MSTNLKLIAALCHTHSLPPLPLIALRIYLDCRQITLTQWPYCWQHKKTLALDHLTIILLVKDS